MFSRIDHSQKTKKTRNRTTIVCTNCKRRKVKCDKQIPCHNCIKSNCQETCSYVVSNKSGANNLNSLNDSKDSNHLKDVDLENSKLEIQSLKLQLAQLSFEISHLKSSLPQPISTPVVTFPPPILSTTFLINRNSILDTKYENLNKLYIFAKPSRTTTRTALTAGPMLEGSKLTFTCVSGFRQLITEERRNWKKKHKTESFSVNFLQFDNLNAEELITATKELICSNYNAFLERLTFFEKHLNKLLFQECIPMDVILLIFNNFFVRNSNGLIDFVPPIKNYGYMPLSLIVLLVDLALIFTENDPKVSFLHELSTEKNELNHLAIKFLNISSFTKKHSIFGVYALLCLRLSLMVYSDAESSGLDHENALPIFQIALNSCFTMGLNRNIHDVKVFYFKKLNVEYYPAKEISKRSIELLWNYMLRLDATYSLILGTPLLINYKFSNGYYRVITDNHYSEIENNYINLLRESTELINTVVPISFNDLVNLNNKLLKFCSDIDSFDDFDKLQYYDEYHWLIVSFKFEIFKISWDICLFIAVNLKNLNINNFFNKSQLENNENLQTINNLKRISKDKCVMGYIIMMKVLTKVSEKNIDNNRFLIFFRDLITRWFGIPTIAYIDWFASEILEKKGSIKTDTIKNSGVLTLDIESLEELLYGNNEIVNLSILSDPNLMVSIISKVYESIIKLPIFYNTYGFFVKAKVFLILIYFLCTVIDVEAENIEQNNGQSNGPDNENKYNFHNKLVELTEKTRVKLEQNLELGVLSEKVNITDNITNRITDDITDNNISANAAVDFDDFLNSALEDEQMVTILKNLNDCPTGEGFDWDKLFNYSM